MGSTVKSQGRGFGQSRVGTPTGSRFFRSTQDARLGRLQASGAGATLVPRKTGRRDVSRRKRKTRPRPGEAANVYATTATGYGNWSTNVGLVPNLQVVKTRFVSNTQEEKTTPSERPFQRLT